MLVEFSVANFRSIRDRVTLSMLATPDQTLLKNTFAVPMWEKERFVKSAFLYGPNASGKTNVLRAMRYLRMLILSSEQRNKGTKIDYEPFLLDENFTKKPSEFEVRFVIENIPYTYGLTVDEERVQSEYLYYAPKGRKAVVFERVQDSYTFTVDKERQTTISQNTISNRLYLASATNANYDKTEPAFKWFKDFLRTRIDMNVDNWQKYTTKCISEGGALSEKIQQFMRKADVGIQSISAKIVFITEDMLRPNTPSEVRKKLLGQEFPEVTMYHQGKNEKVSFDIDDESDGTQVVYAMAGPLFDVLDNGYTLLIDEIEASLHPHIVQEIIKLFHDPACNRKNAQIICTTHATSFLNRELFRRDQLWFTQKDPDSGATELFSLADVKGVRKDENYEKAYWAGKYDAIPYTDQMTGSTAGSSGRSIKR